ncbi:MAG: NAD(P)-dependent oxidoreductase [Methylacidiphilales bacterium]|nr:NAD(P)-dependent oxidoreductase [Candidatus Methylacidiphilales bacterium]
MLAEKEGPYTDQQARVEASRCLYCFDAPCVQSCPTGIDVPAFIRRIAEGNPRGAARVILEANILGASCSRVCPTTVLCEGACVVAQKEGDPVKIGRLQRYATDFVAGEAHTLLSVKSAKTGCSVGVIGAGPAGLACAAELARLGHEVVIYEKKAFGGGLNTYGVAYYKMPPQVSLEEVALVEKLGVTIQYHTEIGRDLTGEELLQKHHLLFLGVGLGRASSLGIPNENSKGILDALDFIENIRVTTQNTISVGANVVIIGCGNTAMDAAIQARLLGAKTVTVLYRRSESEMPAYRFEYERAKKEGINFLFNTLPVQIFLSSDRHIERLRLAGTRYNSNGELEIIRGTEWEIPCDMLIKATGQQKLTSWILQNFPTVQLSSKGLILHDPQTGQTSDPRIFTGGDCANGGREVVHAVAEGKRAAKAMHQIFSAKTATHPSPHHYSSHSPNLHNPNSLLAGHTAEPAYFRSSLAYS